MKKIQAFLFSSKTTLVLLLLFSFAIGFATFLEEKFDTITAKISIYNAWWFELILVLLVINMIGHILKFKLYTKSKIPGFIFHVGFILLIIGAGITRYLGSEGMMHIREYSSSNTFYSSEPYLMVKFPGQNKIPDFQKKLYVSENLENSFKIKFNNEANEQFELEYKNYIPNAIENYIENSQNGVDILELTIANRIDNKNIFINSGQTIQFSDYKFSFNTKSDSSIYLRNDSGKIEISAPFDFIRTDMMGNLKDSLPKSSLTEILPNFIYSNKDISFVFKKLYKHAEKRLSSGTSEQSNKEILQLVLRNKQVTDEINLVGGPNTPAEYSTFFINNTKIEIAYGQKPVQLPFTLHLRDFILERYPGSMSPSSYASEVTVYDSRNGVKKDFRIYMNHILDYDGYRFFQSSYDNDEKGTILSVNQDFWGTWISYISYIMLGIGFILTLFNKNSRFYALIKMINEQRIKRKTELFTLFLILGLSSFVFSQTQPKKPVSKEFAEKFSRIIVQTYDGRFQPINSLAFDVLHKISRKDEFDFPGKGHLNAVQVFMDMHIDPEFWNQQKIIYVREKSVQQAIGINGNLASFTDLVGENNQYKLQQLVETSFRKKPIEQNAFDKEIIKIDERVNIYLSVIQGNELKIFPSNDKLNHSWVTWADTSSKQPISGPVKIYNEQLQLAVFSFNNLFREFLLSLIEANNTGDYSKPELFLKVINDIQRQSISKDLLSSEFQVKTEIFYNEAQIFIKLRNLYSILCLFLLLIAFIDTLKTKQNKILQWVWFGLTGILVMAFLYHTLGLIIRWYLTGHAPWSNGYEALLLVAWASLLAGFIFMRFSKIPLAAAALLAFLMLMTASHSSYDPQLTNLQPVLKSYWLIIHVASITISYGFLGLGFLLGVINLVIILLMTRINQKKYQLIINELSYINEITLIVGLFLATIGTFLGGVWANESWGRYWGWDAKETWALIIVIFYSMILHLRFVPGLKGKFLFNVGAIIGFGTVLMTFLGVNYYLSKGLHSYASGITPVFPLWGWIMIFILFSLIVISGLKQSRLKENEDEEVKRLDISD